MFAWVAIETPTRTSSSGRRAEGLAQLDIKIMISRWVSLAVESVELANDVGLYRRPAWGMEGLTVDKYEGTLGYVPYGYTTRVGSRAWQAHPVGYSTLYTTTGWALGSSVGNSTSLDISSQVEACQSATLDYTLDARNTSTHHH